MTPRLPILILLASAALCCAAPLANRNGYGVRGTATLPSAPTRGLLSYYAFDGNANDSYGTNNGAFTGSPVLTNGVKGISGTAYYFDGTTYMSVATDPLYINSATNCSFAFWAKSSYAWANNAAAVFGTDDSGGGSGGAMEDRGNVNGFTGMRSGLDLALKTSGIYLFGATNCMDTTTWHHYVFTYDGSVGNVYRDGIALPVMVSSLYYATGSYAPKNAQFRICNTGNGSANKFAGFIDNFRIYKVSITSNEVATLYNFEKP